MQQKWNQNFDGEPMADIPQKFLNAERAEDFGADVSLASTASFSNVEGR